ncbi:MAG: methylated-DNA--[protein]-cysteine S-methyltransferase [Chthoniobacterales bacterium]
MKLILERWPSPIDPLFIVTDIDGALRAVDFADREARLHRLLRMHYGTYSLEDGTVPTSITEAFTSYFEGKIAALDTISIATGGTPFQREVWKALRKIPAGMTQSYGELAKHIGRPAGASRAVGAANGSNPLSLVVPCHRVIGANGTLTGYAGGLERKQWLLDHESKHTALGSVAELF